jgi:hypothetical protein
MLSSEEPQSLDDGLSERSSPLKCNGHYSIFRITSDELMACLNISWQRCSVKPTYKQLSHHAKEIKLVLHCLRNQRLFIFSQDSGKRSVISPEFVRGAGRKGVE